MAQQGNPFYVTPMGDHGRDISKAMGGIGKAMADRAAMQQKQSAQAEVAEAVQSGDVVRVRDTMAKYPELAEGAKTAFGFANEQTESMVSDLSAQLMGATSEQQAVDILDSYLPQITNAGGSPIMLAEAAIGLRNGTQTLDQVKAAAMYLNPDLKDVYDKLSSGQGTGTANMQEFARWQDMPEGAEKDAFGRMIGVSESQDAAEKLRLQNERLALDKETLAHQQSKMTAGVEKALMGAQDSVVQAQRSANSFDVLAGEFESRQGELEGGLKMTFSEFLKKSLGTQDEISEFRRRFNKVRLSEGLKNLPPGPATDRDVKEAFKGVPPENASPEQVASFLRGAARLSRLDAAYNQFKADFLSEKGKPAGLNSAWRKKFKSPRLDREVSNIEIYETAQNRGLTPEEVKAELGI